MGHSRNCLILFLLMTMVSFSWANNVVINSVSLSNDSTLTFTVSWENSWRVSTPPYNHDAVWIFIKYRDCAANLWEHVDLSNRATDHSAAAPLEVFIDNKDLGSDAKGVFLRRSTDGVGAIAPTTISLRMKNIPLGEYDFRVMAVEMVQIPQGAFYLGDGTATGRFSNGGTTNAYLVNSENAITVGASAGNLYTNSSTYMPNNLPAAYPKGFDEIYCMKYEISQGQYTDFVNMLPSDQGAKRAVTGTANRLSINGAWPVLNANVPHRAMNFLAWADMLAYLDWSCLRPMSELEFEKICRGTSLPVTGERAWGTNLATDANAVQNNNTATESATVTATAGSGLCNFNNNNVLGPFRCGFAAKTATNRLEAGASYYGVMELSGNVWEQTVGARGTTAVAYIGNVGDGVLTTVTNPGHANQSSWPEPQVSTGATSGVLARAFRGGSWSSAGNFTRVSDRGSINNQDGRRGNSFGGRGVR